jgi:Arc/MetJ-type ribon-helix-helix transcriptional regulator
MSKPEPPEPVTRKSVTLPDSMWREIADYRFSERIGSEAEAVRRLLVAALKTEKRKAAKR